jgi:serine/threonine protein kinase
MFLEKEVYTQSSHPFIVQMAYAFTSKCYAILVLQLARTGTLQDALVSYPEGWLSENAALFYTAEIACALLHLHSLGLMYRDLKPR